LETVRSWAALRSYEYKFLGDEFLAYAPDWFRSKSHSILPVTDLARLLLINEQLTKFDQVIWVDADVLVFDPHAFLLTLEPYSNFAFTSEVWASSPSEGYPIFHRRVNNAVCIFNKHATELEFFIKSALSVMKELDNVGTWDVGVNFLTHAHATKKFQLLSNVGMVSPAIMNDINTNKTEYLPYLGKLIKPVSAVNLCGSFVNKKDYFDTSQTMYDQLVEILLNTKGDAINRFVK